MVNRHGLIAGATGTGKTKTLQVTRRAALERRGPGLRRRRQGRPLRPLPSRASRRAGRDARRRARHGLFDAGGIPGRVPVARRHRPRRPVRATVSDFGPHAARQGPRRPTRRRSRQPRARVPLRRRAGPAAAGPLRPARAAHVPRVRRGQGRTRGNRRPRLSHGRRAAARARAGSRTAAAPSSSASRSSTSGTCCGRRRRRGDDHLPRARRRPGQARAVLDGDDVAGRRAVRGAARGR